MLEHRSDHTELLDRDFLPTADLYQNLKELEFINKYLGGHRVTTKGLKKALSDSKGNHHIADLGCGGGDSLKSIARWIRKHQRSYRLTGIDLKQDCIVYSKKNCSAFPDIRFYCADFRTVFTQADKPDVFHASLFCHHFTNTEIISFIRLCLSHNVLFIINDLERNSLAWLSIRILTALFSKSYLVRNDAPLSVKRGFTRNEWKDMLESAGAKRYSIENCWAFRHLIIIHPNE
jgi:2-polyprenyl-3-methyl-5-hydroxy-6-metoxy-1,4-benzoquinol methylase